MQYTMKLNQSAFDKVLSGKKSVDLRLRDEKRKQLTIGDSITYKLNTDLNQTIAKKVVGLLWAKDFKILFRYIDPTLAGRGAEETPEQIATDMSKYYSEDKVNTYGVLGIFLD